MEPRSPSTGQNVSRRRHLILAVLVAALAFPAAASGQGDALPETFTIDATSDASQFTGTVLRSDRRYTLVVSGTSSVWADESGVIDALYCFESQTCEDRGTIPVRHPKLKINGMSVDTFVGREDRVPYESDHRYELEFTGVSGMLEFTYPDSNYADNSGFYEVLVDELPVPEPQSCDSPFEPGNGGEEIVGRPGVDDTLIGTAGDDVICGLGGDDTIFGGGGQDVMHGGGGDDLLDGEAGADLFLGEGGDDRLLDPVAGELDTFHGGPGTDLLSYSGDRVARVIARIGGLGGNGEGDVIKDSIENLRGTKLNDKLLGNGRSNRLIGGLGSDRLLGKGRGDKLQGGGGGDLLGGGRGPDRIRGGVGDDQLFGDGGRDSIFGGIGDDDLFAKDGRVDRRLRGGPGDLDSAEYDSAEQSKLRSIELR